MFGSDTVAKKKTLADFVEMKEAGKSLTWITAYDYPLAHCAEMAGIDMILVGDSGGMTQLGYATTNPVTMDEMITLSKAVRKGAPNTFIVGDMPQGSYEVSCEEAVRSAMRFVKEAGCDAVKCEGGIRVKDKVSAMVKAGIPVIGHLGLTPQSTVTFGGYRVQGKTRASLEAIIEDAKALEEAGIFALLLEAMPSQPAGAVRRNLNIPVYGIGAGAEMDGQLIIMHDLLGLYGPFRPWFAKCYIPQVLDAFTLFITMQGEATLRKYGREKRGDGLGALAIRAIATYISEVHLGVFPGTEYSYSIKDNELGDIKASPLWKE
jgi:3-methyl-2-oxobutanoate hydroxymethyltransferase